MNLIFYSIKMSAFHCTKQYFRLRNITSLSGCIKYQQILFDNVIMGHNWSRDCINFLFTYYIIGYYLLYNFGFWTNVSFQILEIVSSSLSWLQDVDARGVIVSFQVV